MKCVGLALAAGFLAAAVVDGACPNSCSGHGQCGAKDQCQCHVDWVGGDCSLRACPVNWAWAVTNAHGDLNMDGDRNDVTIYDSDHYFTNSGLSYIVTQNEPKGAWEQWPSYGNTQSKDEGHYYMECSNRGICDRENGQCVCFDGYVGSACQRTRCPSDCSGHGVCKTVSQQKGSYTYNLWDADMSRSCVCDPGYSGPDCADRVCPYGDDPLTTDDQHEVNWVDIYTDIDLVTPGNDRTFAGTFTLKYTDHQGKTWTTDPISVVPYTTSATDMASKVAAALNGLPNDVLSGVTVTQGYPEKVIPGNIKLASNAFAAATNSATSYGLSGKLIRCPATTADKDKIMYSSDGNAMVDYDTTSAITVTDIDDTTCYEVEHRWGVRFKIKFATPGNLNDLAVDISGVTIGGLTNAQRENTLVGGVVRSKQYIGGEHATGGITLGYTHPSQISTTCSGTGGDSCGIVGSTKVVTLTDTTNRDKYWANARVKITCDTLVLGIFTINALHATDPTFTVIETIPDCTIASPANLIVELQSYVLTANADLTGILAAGDVISADSFASDTTKISSVQWSDALGKSHIFLDSEYKGDDANNGETTTTAGTHSIYLQGNGSSEKDECGGRGLCDRESGVCQCFKGFTGSACSTQNALSVE